jgi:hypothetical protein
MSCRYRKGSGALLLLAALSVVVLLALSGCAAVEPTADVPVAVSCVKARPAAPDLRTEAEVLALDDYKAIKGYASELQKRDKYIGELEDVVTVCEGAPSVVTVPR